MSTSLYMQIEGIKGSVNDEGYKDWIALNQSVFSFYNNATIKAGASVGGSQMSGSEVQCLKSTDVATLDLWQKLASGALIPQIVIVSVNRQNDDKSEGIKAIYSNCVLTHFQSMHSANGQIENNPEQWSFAYSSVKYEINAADSSGQIVKTGPYGWDMSLAKKM